MPPCRSSVRPGKGGSDAIWRTVSAIQADDVRDADVEADDGIVSHDIQGPAAADLGDVDGDAFTLAVQAVQAGGDHGRAGDRIGPFVEGPAGVGGLARDDQMVVAAALTRAGQGPVGQRGLIGHADMTARAQFGQQGGRGGRADFLIRRQQDCPADTRPVRMGLEGFQCGQKDRNPALHVRDARAVKGAVGTGRHGLEGALGREDGVIVAGQHDLDRRVGAGGDLQRIGMGFVAHRTVVCDGCGGLCRDANDFGRQVPGLDLEKRQDPGQTIRIAAAGIDIRPVDGATDDGGLARCDMVEHDLVGG
jgi:hypothetical protein